MSASLLARQAWTTHWVQVPAIRSLSIHQHSFPNLSAILYDFHFIGYQISRTLFVHKRRIANASNIGLCDCGLCTRRSPCGLDPTTLNTYINKILEVEEKLVYDFDLLDITKNQVDDELSDCMIMLASEEHTGVAGEDGGPAGDALYAFNAWWSAKADQMIEDLKNICLALDMPVFGSVAVNQDDMMMCETPVVGGQVESAIECVWHFSDEQEVEVTDSKKEEFHGVNGADNKDNGVHTIVRAPKKEWTEEGNDFMSRKLFAEEQATAASNRIQNWAQDESWRLRLD